MNQEFKLRLKFISLVSLSGLIGFCAGVVSIPLYLFNEFSSSEPATTYIWLVALAPIGGFINGLFLGVLAYPLYWWITKKISFKYRGQLYINE